MAEEEKTIHDVFTELKTKHSLPEFDELNAWLNIEDVDPEDGVLRDISKKAAEKFDSYASMIDSILQPDSTLQDMHECAAFEESNKKDMFELFKKLMFNYRSWKVIEVEFSDEQAAKYITTSFQFWITVKPRVKEVLTKIRNSWNEDFSNKLNPEYFG